MIFNENGIILNESKIDIDSIFGDKDEVRFDDNNFSDIPKSIYSKIQKDCKSVLSDMYDEKIKPYLNTAKISSMNKKPSKSDFTKTCKIFSIRFIKWEKGNLSFSLDISISSDYIHYTHIIILEMNYDNDFKLLNYRSMIDG